jgi:membrane associated rhomboid family serine protease
MHPLETILRRCAEAAPQPWYPSAYAQAAGIPRDSLDPHLERLRLAGLIHLTDWVQGHGQGYALTPVGVAVLQNPRYLDQLRGDGQIPHPDRLGDLQPLSRGDARGWERRQALRAALTGPARPAVTYLLIGLNLLWFLAGLSLAAQYGVPPAAFLGISVDPQVQGQILAILHVTGAITYADIYAKHQWWRLLSCCFVHFGIVHLGVNMYSLYVVGPLLERMWGWWRFLLLYLIAGLGGSCAMIMWPKPSFIGAGASGALWGVLASMVTWILLNRRFLPRELASGWLRNLLFVFGLNAVITLYFQEFISKEAHFGGGLVGLVAAVPMNYARFGRGWQRGLALLGLLVVVLLGLGWFVLHVLRDGRPLPG